MTARTDADLRPAGIPRASGHAAPAASDRVGRAIERPLAESRTAGGGVPGTPYTGRTGGALLAMASCLLLLLAAAQGYVSFRAQYVFIDHAKQAHLPSMLEALGLDTGTVIFALLALSLARRGKRGTVERVLNVACAFGSLTMNLLAADLNSPRSVTVWVMPSALYALASDRLIAVMRRWAQASDPGAELAEGPAWRTFGGLAFWILRLSLDAPGTVAGFRRWVLAAAPVAPGIRAGLPADGGGALPAGEPDATAGGREDQEAERWPGELAAHHEPRGQAEPPAPDASGPRELIPGEKKRDALIRLYERCGETGDPRYGNEAKAAELAGEIATSIGYHAGTARRELAKYLASHSAAVKTVPTRGDAAPTPGTPRNPDGPEPPVKGPHRLGRDARAAVKGRPTKADSGVEGVA